MLRIPWTLGSLKTRHVREKRRMLEVLVWRLSLSLSELVDSRQCFFLGEANATAC